MIECVPDAKSRDQIGRKINTDLFVYFKKEYGEESSQGRERRRLIACLRRWPDKVTSEASSEKKIPWHLVAGTWQTFC